MVGKKQNHGRLGATALFLEHAFHSPTRFLRSSRCALGMPATVVAGLRATIVSSSSMSHLSVRTYAE